MRRRRASSGAMHARIDGRAADLLIAGELPGPELAGVAEVLAAAAAPPRPDELAGEEAAVAAFRAARGQAAGWRRRRDGLSSRIFVATRAKVVAMAVIAAVALGAGVAAGTGLLPSGAQRVAHSALHKLGVPGPDRGRQARSTPEITATGPRASARRPDRAAGPGDLARRAVVLRGRGDLLRLFARQRRLAPAHALRVLDQVREVVVERRAADPGRPEQRPRARVVEHHVHVEVGEVDRGMVVGVRGAGADAARRHHRRAVAAQGLFG